MYRFTPLVAALVVSACAAPTPSSTPGVAAAPKAPATAATRMKAADRQAILAHHNKVRADVGVAPLRWDDKLAAYAQEWAEHLAAKSCRMQHRQPNAYGENLFQGTAGRYSAIDAAKGWESEKKDYRGEPLTPKNFAPVGHYTQMVWRDTKRVGCGEALCNGTLIVACNYDPPGNVLGRTPY